MIETVTNEILADNVLESLMKSIDVDGDGEVDNDEFLEWWTTRLAIHGADSTVDGHAKAWWELGDGMINPHGVFHTVWDLVQSFFCSTSRSLSRGESPSTKTS